MTSPAHMEPAAESFEAYRDRFLAGYPGALGEKAVCLLYDQVRAGEAQQDRQHREEGEYSFH